MIDAVSLWVDSIASDTVFLDVLAKCSTIHTLNREVKEVTLCKFDKDTENTTCTVLLLN